MDKSEEDRKRRSVAEEPTITSGSSAVPPPVPPAPGAPPGAAGGGHGSAYGPSPYAAPAPSPPPSPSPSAYGQQGHQPYGAGGAYGYPSPGPQPYGYGYGAGAGPGYGWHGAPPATGKPVAAMVIGIIGLVAVSTCWGSFLGIILSPIALGLGLSGRRAADRGEGGGRGQAVAGFVMGIVGTVLSVLCIAFLVVMLVFYSEELDGNPGPGGSGDGPSLDARGSTSAPAVPLGTDAPGAGVPGAGVPVAAGSADTADRGA